MILFINSEDRCPTQDIHSPTVEKNNQGKLMCTTACLYQLL